MTITKQDIEVLSNLMVEYSKENGFPFYEKIIESGEFNKAIFSRMSRGEYYSNFMKDYILKKIDDSRNTKMGKLLKEKYEKNNVLFTKFVVLNIKKEFNEEFNTV